MKYFAVLLVITTLAGCTYFGGSTHKAKSEELIDQAKKNCQLLGYDPNTRQYLDCTTGQFNKMQEQYYGPLQ